MNHLKPYKVLEIGPGPGVFFKNWMNNFPKSKYFVLETDKNCHPVLKKLGAEILDIKDFEKNMGKKFELKYSLLCECLLFLNSGGVTSKTFYIPLNFFFLKIISYLDKFLTFIFPKLFALGYKIVLEKK